MNTSNFKFEKTPTGFTFIDLETGNSICDIPADFYNRIANELTYSPDFFDVKVGYAADEFRVSVKQTRPIFDQDLDFSDDLIELPWIDQTITVPADEFS